jgi:hypothetical protein
MSLLNGSPLAYLAGTRPPLRRVNFPAPVN